MSSRPPSDTDLPPFDNLRAAVWMFSSAVCFSGVWLAIKVLGHRIPAAEMVFFRSFVGMIVLTPFFIKKGLGVFSSQRVGLHIIRVVAGTINIVASYYGVAHLPLAMANSLTFTRPLFMVVLAIAILGERVHWRRAVATVLGFIGVLLVLGPTDMTAEPAAWVALGGAAAAAVALAVIRQQAVVDGPVSLMAWFVTGCTLLSAIPAALNWQTPVGIEWLYVLIIGVGSSAGQFMLVKAFAHGEATVVNPIDYTQIILGALFGYMLFGETPDIWTAVGTAVIITSTLYILIRDSRVMPGRPPPIIEE